MGRESRKSYALKRDFDDAERSSNVLQYQMSHIKGMMKQYKRDPVLRSHVRHLKKLWLQLELSNRKVGKLKKNLEGEIAAERNEQNRIKKNR